MPFCYSCNLLTHAAVHCISHASWSHTSQHPCTAPCPMCHDSSWPMLLQPMLTCMAPRLPSCVMESILACNSSLLIQHSNIPADKTTATDLACLASAPRAAPARGGRPRTIFWSTPRSHRHPCGHPHSPPVPPWDLGGGNLWHDVQSRDLPGPEVQ